jgi:hypothetical protein
VWVGGTVAPCSSPLRRGRSGQVSRATAGLSGGTSWLSAPSGQPVHCVHCLRALTRQLTAAAVSSGRVVCVGRLEEQVVGRGRRGVERPGSWGYPAEKVQHAHLHATTDDTEGRFAGAETSIAASVVRVAAMPGSLSTARDWALPALRMPGSRYQPPGSASGISHQELSWLSPNPARRCSLAPPSLRNKSPDQRRGVTPGTPLG